jgi:peroxiredoxin
MLVSCGNMKERPMSLREELAAFTAAMPHRVPTERLAILERATESLTDSGIVERAAKVGDRAPDFSLSDAAGNTVALADLLAKGPIVVTFYRDGWCPFCNMELRAYQRLLPEIAALGAGVVAISPQASDHSLLSKEKNALTFPILSDAGGQTAARFGLRFELPADLRAVYAAFGNDLPRINAEEGWHLPVPATYVIAADGRIVLAEVDPDYRMRPDPEAVVAALHDLRHVRSAA